MEVTQVEFPKVLAGVTVTNAVDGSPDRGRVRGKDRARRSGPVKVHDGAELRRQVYIKAMALARGDSSRLKLQPDGSIIVRNARHELSL